MLQEKVFVAVERLNRRKKESSSYVWEEGYNLNKSCSSAMIGTKTFSEW